VAGNPISIAIISTSTIQVGTQNSSLRIRLLDVSLNVLRAWFDSHPSVRFSMSFGRDGYNLMEL
jgi:hypothetical protein